jgi:hypothetical protein
LIGDGNGDESILERHRVVGAGHEHESPDVLAPRQHRQLDALRRQVEPAAPKVVAAEANEDTAAKAVIMPAARPPSAAIATTTIVSTSAALVLSNSGRKAAITAPTPTASGTPTAQPITKPVASRVGAGRSR